MSLLLWKALESYGCDNAALFKKVGLDPDKMRDPNARYPETALMRLWELALEETKDPCMGLTVARNWHPSTLHALGFAWLASTTLKDAFERLVRYSRILVDIDRASLEETEDAFCFKIITPIGYIRAPDESYDAYLAVVLDMCRVSYGQELNPQRVTMMRGMPKHCSGEFFQLFRAPIEFSASEDALYFGKAKLLEDLPTANTELARANDEIIQRYLASLDRANIAMQVRTKLVEQLSSGHATQTSIAKSLNMSTRSLQRKLKEEGSSFKEILEQTRRDLAQQYVREGQMSTKEITYLLGFSEPSNFARAFTRWTGVSPSEYRE